VHASEIIRQFKSLGYHLKLNENGKLVVRPCPPDHEAPRLAPLARLVQQHREEVIRFLQSERSDVSKVSNAPRDADGADISAPIPTLPLDLGRIADAIAAHPRSPILGDMALAVFARHAVEAQRTIERLPTAAKVEAFRRCREVENRIVAAIVGHDYQQAYALAAALPGELAALTLQ
jgi:hypothetical protein